LRKTFFYTGILFLLIGLAFLIASSYLREIKQVLVDSTSKSWEISADLEQGKTYVIDIVSSDNWTSDFTRASPDTPDTQPVDVVITSPSGGETNLTAFFYGRLPSNSYYQSTRPVVVEVKYASVDSYSLQVDEHYPRIRFTTKQGRNYTARIIERTLNWTFGPPNNIMLYIEVIEDQNSRGLVLQSGGILSIIGVVVSVYGIRTTKKLKVRRTNKFKK